MMDFQAEDQYRSMMRSYEALKEHATDMGPLAVIGYEASDYAREFFTNCYHLKDWLKKDGRVQPQIVEQFVAGSIPLSIAGDVCNSLKHAGLNRPPKSGAPLVAINTALTVIMPSRVPPGTEIGKIEFRRNPRDGDTVSLARADVSRPMAKAAVVLTVGTKKYDGFALATDCVADWDRFLANHGFQFSLKE